MLYFALIASGVLLLAVNVATRGKSRPVVITSLAGLALSFLLPVLGFVSLPVVIVHAVLLFVVSIYWRWTKRGSRRMFALSAAATVLAYVIFLPRAVERSVEYAALREGSLAYRSMEDRLPPLQTGTNQPPLADAARWDRFEEKLDEWGGDLQTRRLHEDHVRGFVKSWGFGVGRMSHFDELKILKRRGDAGPVAPPQPSNPSYATPTAQSPSSIQVLDLDGLHSDGLDDFLHPSSFGYVKDRQNVAGFRSHSFRKMPDIHVRDENRVAVGWEVARLELVSLLMHKEPCVYLSDRLPQMDALKGVPTRPLDAFETEGLAVLRKGEDLFVREDRMVGSIRSVKQCIACHGGDRGQLLGAFTYTLRPTGK